MRIIGGRYKGLTLASLGSGDTAAHLRPTPDRVRESIFNILSGGRHGDPITGRRVLDLFAGTGALGLEALSRGAANVTFVDNGAKAAALIRQNITKTDAVGQCALFRQDATRPVPCSGAAFELVFLDPPYGRGLGGKALAAYAQAGCIAKGALVLWEDNAAREPPDGFTPRETRRYGGTYVMVLEYHGD